jgi:hypothetical protein
MTSEFDVKFRIRPEDNPWYLLATLYGQPLSDDLQAQNRSAWNRYLSRWLKDDIRIKLIGERRHVSEELTPFSADEIDAIEKAFFVRCGRIISKASGKIPELEPDGLIDFSNIDFDSPFSVEGFFFPVGCDFSSASFSRIANFKGANFSDATFKGVSFSGTTVFDGAIFSTTTTFKGANFSGRANFEHTTFSFDADFGGATFSDLADFSGATFSDVADFTRATFSDLADFTGATFQSTLLFVNAKMNGPTLFQAATFSSPPRFFGAELHEGTVWRQVKWPDPPSNTATADAFVDAYERLKLEMDRLKKHEDELFFFAHEMKSRRVQSGVLRGMPIVLYGVLCNYGRSYVRPLVGLLVTIAIGAMLYLTHFGISKYPRAVGLSLANTFGVLGFRKDFIDPSVIEALSRALKVVSAVQSVVGIGLLFLFGLALRNRFRMR